jgi:putative SOS response-associated peptidase YedK
MINARAETLAEKPAFRTAYRRRRCLIPADGFYEWRKESDGTKTPIYLRMKNGKLFGFAGLWETWRDASGADVRSCTIITTRPNELVAKVHDRMPVIVPPEKYRQWLDPNEHAPADLDPLLVPCPAEQMESFPVSTRINNPRAQLVNLPTIDERGVSG